MIKVCVGLNYQDHAVEANMPIPSETIRFLKPTSAIVGPNDDVEIPVGAENPANSTRLERAPTGRSRDLGRLLG